MKHSGRVMVLFVGILTSFVVDEIGNWVQRSPAVKPDQRSFHDMAYDSVRRKVVLFAGTGVLDPQGALVCCYDDTWNWDGVNWTLQSPSPHPSARGAHGMAFDAARSQVVLFGGYSPQGGDLSDTWVYDGTAWTAKMPTTVPPGRAGPSMVFDSARNEIVIFGGGLLNDTWVWNGSNWTQRSPSTRPPVRNHQTMAFDAARGEVVLFGGYKDALNVDMWNDTWVWNGTNWTQKFPNTAPSARVDHGMAYSSRGVILFGGLEQVGAGAHFTNDTWLWTGSNWVQQQPATIPPATDFARLAWDSFRQEVVLFGKPLSLIDTTSQTWVWIVRRLGGQITSQ